MFSSRYFGQYWGWTNDFDSVYRSVYSRYTTSAESAFDPGNFDDPPTFDDYTEEPPSCTEGSEDSTCVYVGENYDSWLLDQGYPCDCNQDGCSDISPSCCGDGNCPTCSCTEDGCSADSPDCCGEGTCQWATTQSGAALPKAPAFKTNSTVHH